MPQIEARPYGPNITAEERALLRTQVYLVEPDIVMWREVPVTTVYQIDVYEEKLRELSRDVERVFLVIDLTVTARPSSAVIARLRQMFANQPKLEHSAIFTGKNFMLNVAAKFVLARLGFFSFSMHSTEQQAIEAVNLARKHAVAG